MRWTCGSLTTLAILAMAPIGSQASASDSAGVELFEKKIRPLLAEHCYSCHGEKKQESGLALNSFSSLRKGGDRGPAVMAGDPEQSLIVTALRYADDDLKMPPR